MRHATALTLALLLSGPLAAPGHAQVPPPVPQISVTGEGRVEARPDMATITLGVTTQALTAAEAMRANSTELAKVLERLKASGIADRDLQTTGLSLNPNWRNYDSGQTPTIDGYIAQNTLTVRVRALDTLGTVLDTAVQDGANTLNGISFGLSDPAPQMDEARKRAVADALARARLLTAAAGVTLGPILSITESGGYTDPQPMFRRDAVMEAAPVPVAEGEVSLNASVTLVLGLVQP